MWSAEPGAVKSICRYARRLSSVDSTPIESKRFLIVPLDSSAARMPLPGATIAWAISVSVARSMGVSSRPLHYLDGSFRRLTALPHLCAMTPASLPLDGAGRLAGDVVRHPVETRNFVDDSGRHPLEQIVWQARP